MPKQKVMVGWSDNGGVLGVFAHSLMRLQHYEFTEPGSTYNLMQPGRTAGLYVQNNRNEMVLLAQESKADWLLQLDGDESFSPSLLRQLMSSADAERRPIVAGLYSNIGNVNQETGSFTPVDCIYAETADGSYRTLVPPDNMRPFRVDAVGSGVLLTHMSVFEKIKGPWFWLEMFQYPDGKRAMMNEDIAFCRMAREHGFEIWCDPLAEVTHWKTLPLVPSTLRGFLKRATEVEQEMAGAGRKS